MLSKKGALVMNGIMNMANACALSLTGAIQNNALSPFTIVLILIAFICACLVTAVIPVSRMGNAFAGLFKLEPQSTAGRLVSNVVVTLIYVLIINFVMTAINVRFQMPVLLIAYLTSLPLMFIVSYIVSLVITPIALKVAVQIK